jgi:FlaA1/EpsC-like NDP-sugar epimerase
MTIPEPANWFWRQVRWVMEESLYFDMVVKIIDLARKMIKLAGFIPDKDIMIRLWDCDREVIRRIA